MRQMISDFPHWVTLGGGRCGVDEKPCIENATKNAINSGNCRACMAIECAVPGIIRQSDRSAL
jgi:hypothetical protein